MNRRSTSLVVVLAGMAAVLAGCAGQPSTGMPYVTLGPVVTPSVTA